MTPYLAVLKDCFREAIASRILWLLTGLITLVLFVGLAPFTLLEESAARFQRNEFRNGPEFLKYLASLETSKEPTAAQRVWSRLPDSVRHRLHDANNENVNEQVEVLNAVRGELNGMLNNNDLYDPALWTPRMLTPEAKHLQQRGVGNLSEEERQRLNRLLIDAAFADYILPAPGKVLYATWFGYRLGTPLPFEPKQLPLLVNFALAALTTFLAGILGVFIAILVTAPTVPQTFEPGAIDLLLSKPVSRSLLFLTKFFGDFDVHPAQLGVLDWRDVAYRRAAVQYLERAALVVHSRLPVPVHHLLFRLGFDRRHLAKRDRFGLLHNSVLGTLLRRRHGQDRGRGDLPRSDAPGRHPSRGGKAARGQQVRADVRMVDRPQGVGRNFSRPRRDGAGLFFRDRLLGPVYDPKADRLVAIESKPTRFEFFGSPGKLLVGPRNQDWRRIDSAGTPGGPHSLFIDPQGRIVVVSLTGIFRFEGTGTHEHHPFNVLGIDLAPHEGSDHFVRMSVSPEQKWQHPFAAAMNPADGELAIFSRGTLTVLAPAGENKYKLRGRTELETDKGASLAFAGSRVVVAMADGRVRLFADRPQAASSPLPEEALLKPAGSVKPRCRRRLSRRSLAGGALRRQSAVALRPGAHAALFRTHQRPGGYFRNHVFANQPAPGSRRLRPGDGVRHTAIPGRRGLRAPRRGAGDSLPLCRLAPLHGLSEAGRVGQPGHVSRGGRSGESL